MAVSKYIKDHLNKIAQFEMIKALICYSGLSFKKIPLKRNIFDICYHYDIIININHNLSVTELKQNEDAETNI